MRDQYYAATQEAAKQVYDAYIAFQEAITAYIQKPSFLLHGHPEDRRIDIRTADAISDWHRNCDRSAIGDAICTRKDFYARRPADDAASFAPTKSEARDAMIKAFDAAVGSARTYRDVLGGWDLWSETEASVEGAVDNRVGIFVADALLRAKDDARTIAYETRIKLLDEPVTRRQMFEALKASKGAE